MVCYYFLQLEQVVVGGVGVTVGVVAEPGAPGGAGVCGALQSGVLGRSRCPHRTTVSARPPRTRCVGAPLTPWAQV